MKPKIYCRVEMPEVNDWCKFIYFLLAFKEEILHESK